ncbi:hypothetical protein C1646_770595, partial [Rhizophagus diaphanus]
YVKNNIFKKQECSLKSDENVEIKDDITEKNEKGDYQIAICQDGKFAVIFDTANPRIKILQNIDYRPPKFGKSKRYGIYKPSISTNETNENIADFKVDDDFAIKNFYKGDKPSFHNEVIEEINSNEDNGDEKIEPFKWSFDISNMHKKDGKSFILVAISRINVDEDMKGPNSEINVVVDDNTIKKGIAVYRVEVEEKESKDENLDYTKDSEDQNKKEIAINRIEYEVSAVTCYYSNEISGICKFIEVSSEDDDYDLQSSHDEDDLQSSHDSQLKRFIIFNFHGIYNFKFND